jgi:hypothetical protein
MLRSRPALLADGLTDWLRGLDTIDGEASSQILSEFFVRGLMWLRAQEDKDVRR